MPKREKARAAKALLKGEKGGKTPISYEQLREVSRVVEEPGSGMEGIMRTSEELGRTEAKGPEDAPIREYASLDIPLWLAYYDDLVVAKEEFGDGRKSPFMEPSRYMREVAPHGFKLERGVLPSPTKERRRAARERLMGNQPFDPGSKDVAPAWFDMDIAKESFASEVLEPPPEERPFNTGSARMYSGYTRAGMTDKYPTERYPRK